MSERTGASLCNDFTIEFMRIYDYLIIYSGSSARAPHALYLLFLIFSFLLLSEHFVYFILTIQAECLFVQRDLQCFRFLIDPIGMEGPSVDWWFSSPGTTEIRDTRHQLVEKLLSRGRVGEGNPNICYRGHDPQHRAHPLSKRGCCEPKMVSVLQVEFLMESNETLLRCHLITSAKHDGRGLDASHSACHDVQITLSVSDHP